MDADNSSDTAVLYNANCPVCSYEINHYAKYSASENLPVVFDDLNDAKKLQDWGLDEDRAAKRLHVMKDGKLHAGIPAFLVLWDEMPKYRWLARVVALPGIFRIACWSYDLILAPLIYRWHLRRQKKRPVEL